MVPSPSDRVSEGAGRQPSPVNGEISDLDQGFVLGLIRVEMRRMMIVPELLNDDITRQSRDRCHLGHDPDETPHFLNTGFLSEKSILTD
jgi:hypothetical protein